MFKNPILLTIISCGIFFLLATATSPPDDFENFFQINLSVTVSDSNLVISNNDTIDIRNAFLVLEKPTGDSTNGFPITIPYLIDNYRLDMGLTDTFSMSLFKREDTLAYPIDTFPSAFNLDFQDGESVGFFNVDF